MTNFSPLIPQALVVVGFAECLQVITELTSDYCDWPSSVLSCTQPPFLLLPIQDSRKKRLEGCPYGIHNLWLFPRTSTTLPYQEASMQPPDSHLLKPIFFLLSKPSRQRRNKHVSESKSKETPSDTLEKQPKKTQRLLSVQPSILLRLESPTSLTEIDVDKTFILSPSPLTLTGTAGLRHRQRSRDQQHVLLLGFAHQQGNQTDYPFLCKHPDFPT